VAEVLPLSRAELRLLASLLRHKVRFMVVGLFAAALQGAPVVTEDIHLWFEDLGEPRLAQALAQVDAAYVPPFGWNPPMLAGKPPDSGAPRGRGMAPAAMGGSAPAKDPVRALLASPPAEPRPPRPLSSTNQRPFLRTDPATVLEHPRAPQELA
jgi:hypothetical protein